MIQLTFNGLRGYNGVTKLDDDITLNGVTVPPTFVYRDGQGVGPDLGPELVIDGDMEAAGTAAWPGLNGGIMSKETTFPAIGTQLLRITRNTIDFPYTQQELLTVGDTYLIDVVHRGDGTFGAIIREGGNTLKTGDPSTDWQRYRAVFTATGAEMRVLSQANGAPGHCDVGYLSVKKINPVYGPDLVTNGNFADWTGDDPDDWVVGGETATSYITEDPAGCRLVSDGSNIYMYQLDAVEAGKTYRATFDVVSLTGSCRFEGGTTLYTTILTPGSYEIEIAPTDNIIRFIRNTACDMVLNNVVIQETHHGGYLPPHAPGGAETLYETGSGAALDFDVPAYGNGVDDRAIRFNDGTYLQASTAAFGNLGVDHFIARFALVPSGATEVFCSKRDGGVGYEFGIDSSDRLYCIVQDATGSTTLTSAALNIGQAYEADFIAGRDEGSWDPSKWMVNGEVSGTPGSISSRSLSLDNTELLTAGATSGGASESTSSLIYLALYSVEIGPLVPPASVFLNDFQKWCDAYPDIALGTPNPSALVAEETFIEEYDPADGFISLHHISENVLPVGRVRDLAGELFYGMRLAPSGSNLLTYSNDLDTGWTNINSTIFTGELKETPAPGEYYQGIVGNIGASATHGTVTVVITAAVYYTFSAVITPGSLDYVAFRNDGASVIAYFDVSDPSVVSVPTGATAGVRDLGGGNVLCWVTVLCTAASNGFYVYPSADGSSASYVGDGTTVQTWVAFAQLEPGIYPTPRILTEGATGSRAADEIEYDLSDGNINPSKFFFQFEYLNQFGNTGGPSPICELNGFGGINMALTAAGLVDVGGGVLQSSTAITDGYTHKVGLFVDGADLYLYIDDTLEGTHSYYSPLVVDSSIIFLVEDRTGQGSTFWIRDVRLYNDNPYQVLLGDGAQEGDVLLYQSLDNGAINVVDGITEMTPTFDTMIYLSLFGGNEDDPGGSDTTKQWWGNIDETDPAKQYRSYTQHILWSSSANSTNLKRLEQAAVKDLTRDFLDTGIASEVSVSVEIPRLNWVSISGTINADGNAIDFKYTVNWEASI